MCSENRGKFSSTQPNRKQKLLSARRLIRCSHLPGILFRPAGIQPIFQPNWLENSGHFYWQRMRQKILTAYDAATAIEAPRFIRQTRFGHRTAERQYYV